MTDIVKVLIIIVIIFIVYNLFNFQEYFSSTTQSTDYKFIGCYKQSSTPRISNNVGRITFNDCRNKAISNNNKVMGFQNIQLDGTGDCLLGDDLLKAANLVDIPVGDRKKLCMNYSHIDKIIISEQGTNKIISDADNSSNISHVGNNKSTAVYSVLPKTDTLKGNYKYIGCYKDKKNDRAISQNLGKETAIKCNEKAATNYSELFGIQNRSNPNDNKKGECWIGNDIISATKHGLVTSSDPVNQQCAKFTYNINNVNHEMYLGNDNSNAIYQKID